MSKQIDITKKSNIKCEHCLFCDKDKEMGYWCTLQEKKKNYWNRCKDFKFEIRK